MALLYDINKNETLMKEHGRISAVPLDPRYAAIWSNYETELGSFWLHKKINFKEDIKAFPNAPKEIQESTLKVQGAFAGSDEIVEEIIKKSPLNSILIPEIQYTLTFEAMMENIHSTVYNNTIAAIVPDKNKRNALFRAVETMPSVAKKADWARQYIRPDRKLDDTVIGKACVEAINFSSSFAWIDWLKTQNYRFDGMYEANDEISRDEARHVETGCHIHALVDDKTTPDRAKDIIDGSLEVEIQFVRDVIPTRGYNGMNQSLMIEHVRHCAAILARDLGYHDFYKGTNSPFGFIKLRGLNSKVNMFEKNETQYTVFGSSNEDESIDDAFEDNADW